MAVNTSAAVLALGLACILASTVWLLVTKRTISYDRRSTDPGAENQVVMATLLGAAGVVVIIASTFILAFSGTR